MQLRDASSVAGDSPRKNYLCDPRGDAVLTYSFASMGLRHVRKVCAPYGSLPHAGGGGVRLHRGYLDCKHAAYQPVVSSDRQPSTGSGFHQTAAQQSACHRSRESILRRRVLAPVNQPLLKKINDTYDMRVGI